MLPSHEIYGNTKYTNQTQRYFNPPGRENRYNTITTPLSNPLTNTNMIVNPMTSNTMINPLVSNTMINPMTTSRIINPLPTTNIANPLTSSHSQAITFELPCKLCKLLFGQANSNNQPRILPCGHSYCQSCLNEIQREYINNSILQSNINQSGTTGILKQPMQSFSCIECGSRIQIKSIQSAPVNRLYYSMLESIKEYLQQKQWQGEYKKQNEQQQELYQNQQEQDFDQVKIKFENKCLYMFCHNLKFQKDKIREVYCSAKCRELGEGLWAVEGVGSGVKG